MNENGDLVFTGKAWANHLGENIITVRIYSYGKWSDAGVLVYDVE